MHVLTLKKNNTRGGPYFHRQFHKITHYPMKSCVNIACFVQMRSISVVQPGKNKITYVYSSNYTSCFPKILELLVQPNTCKSSTV